MLIFKESVSIHFINSFDEKTDAVTNEEDIDFDKGDRLDADIIDDNNETVNIQCGDGSVAFGIPKTIFEIE